MNEKNAPRITDWNETFVEDTLNEPRLSYTNTYAYKTRSNEALFKFGQSEQSLRSVDADNIIVNLVCDSADMRTVPVFLDNNKFSNPFFRFRDAIVPHHKATRGNSHNSHDEAKFRVHSKTDEKGIDSTNATNTKIVPLPEEKTEQVALQEPTKLPKVSATASPARNEVPEKKSQTVETPQPVPKAPPSPVVQDTRIVVKKNTYYMGDMKMAVDDDPGLSESWNRQFKMHILQNHQNLLELKEAQRTEKPLAVPVKPVLPAGLDKSKVLLVLDIDETLVHVIKAHEKIKPKHNLKLSRLGYPTIDIRFNIRPFVRDFLREMKQSFHLALMTASQRVYAELMYGFLDPGKDIFVGLFSKENCVNYSKGRSVKDLSSFDYPLERILLVDNFISAFALQVTNGIPILPFYEEEEDVEVLKLARFLKENILGKGDVRQTIQDTFHTRLFHENSNTRALVVELQDGFKLVGD